MKALKKLPVTYKGELHDVHLLNVSVDMAELAGKVPASLRIRDFNGRALFSMVDVTLKRMRPAFLPPFLSFGYRHIAFRLLVDDAQLNEGQAKGIYFLRSFTQKKWVAVSGDWMTNYNLTHARISPTPGGMELTQGDRFIRYKVGRQLPTPQNPDWLKVVGAIDRAYSVMDDNVFVTQVLRKEWPLAEVKDFSFETNFFRTAKPEAAFKVTSTIHYTWLPPKLTQYENHYPWR